MYMRIVRAQPPQGQLDDLARHWTAFWPERLRAQPGFQHAHFGIDRTTGTIASVTVFDQRPDDTLFERLSREFQADLGQAAPPQGAQFTVYLPAPSANLSAVATLTASNDRDATNNIGKSYVMVARER